MEVANDKIGYYADLLYNAMQGAGTDDKTLIRIVLSRSELDLGDIKAKYLEKYGKTLDHSIDVSGGGRGRVHLVGGEMARDGKDGSGVGTGVRRAEILGRETASWEDFCYRTIVLSHRPVCLGKPMLVT